MPPTWRSFRFWEMTMFVMRRRGFTLKGALLGSCFLDDAMPCQMWMILYVLQILKTSYACPSRNLAVFSFHALGSDARLHAPEYQGFPILIFQIDSRVVQRHKTNARSKWMLQGAICDCLQHLRLISKSGDRKLFTRTVARLEENNFELPSIFFLECQY